MTHADVDFLLLVGIHDDGWGELRSERERMRGEVEFSHDGGEVRCSAIGVPQYS